MKTGIPVRPNPLRAMTVAFTLGSLHDSKIAQRGHEPWRHASLRASDGGIFAASPADLSFEATRGKDAAITGRLGSLPPPGWFMESSRAAAPGNALGQFDGLTPLQFRRARGANTEQVSQAIANADVLQFARKESTFSFSAARYGETSVPGQVTNNDQRPVVVPGQPANRLRRQFSKGLTLRGRITGKESQCKSYEQSQSGWNGNCGSDLRTDTCRLPA